MISKLLKSCGCTCAGQIHYTCTSYYNGLISCSYYFLASFSGSLGGGAWDVEPGNEANYFHDLYTKQHIRVIVC